ncbi:PREDICTED: tumor necrosis factor alpha-induced protein 2 [Gekko japonicus]|uniref:Tumor necrosis factor alpha-induced protein 2 n=1 Tax=Gekko japonicus TaxID=146911 RepID=A0ABM1JKJ3_GEKJA|nr:PREDICTED: tumor necrosis factor alpha-induced protein 2 [Gekko japonicus]XP_015261980.1 PREDICTED: tumor necrosis factor alpha-induced protein 2 [Gekko japonicus]
MIKTMRFFHSSPIKQSPSNKDLRRGSETTPRPSTSSESEPDTASIESSADETQPKGNMITHIQREAPGLPNSPSEIGGKGTSGPEPNKHKGIKGKIINALSPISVGKAKIKYKKKNSKQEESKPITVDQIRELIREKQLFEAGQHLLMMEKESSDEQSEEGKGADRREIEAVYGLLKHEALRIVKTSVRIAPTNPELLQNTVRAITEQVKEDERTALEEASGKSLSARPRQWKEDWKRTIQESVAERMQVPPFDGVEGLSATAHSFLHMGKAMKDDLITVVQHVKPHYSSDFQVCCVYAECYYRCFSSQLEAIAQFELGSRDNALLLTWVQNIYPNEIKKHPVLEKELEEASLGSLLPLEQIKPLEESYLINESESLKRCLARCLQMEVTRWRQGREPEKLDGHFHSELSIDAIQAVYGGQKRAKDITPDLGRQIAPLLLVELLTFLQSYKKELERFIKENKQHQYFEATVIGNINNCLSFRIHTEENTMPGQDDVKQQIFTVLNEIQDAGFSVLLQGLFQELQALFKKFTQKTWLSSTGIMNEIIACTSVHMSTLQTLKEPFRQAIMEKIHLHLVREHIARLVKKKVSLKSAEQQSNLAKAIQSNASVLRTFCTENGSSATWLDPVLPSLAEIIKLQDTNAIMVEVGGLASRYPDISKKHLAAILYFKGNLSSSDTKGILSVLDIHLNSTLPPTSLFLGLG